MASITLSGLLQCGYLDMDKDLLVSSLMYSYILLLLGYIW